VFAALAGYQLARGSLSLAVFLLTVGAAVALTAVAARVMRSRRSLGR
jgi:uncharacterized membrane protein